MAFDPLQEDLSRPVRDWAEGLRETAAATGLSLRQLADRLHCSPSTLSRYLSGERVVQDAWDVVDPMLAVLRDNDREPPVQRSVLRQRYERAAEVYQPGLRNGGSAAEPDAGQEAADPADPAGPAARRRFGGGGIAAAAVALALVVVGVAGSLSGWWGSLFGSAGEERPASARASVPTAPLVTGYPPATVPGKVVRTWSDEKKTFIGVFRFPSATTTAGKALGPGENDIVRVVCRKPDGRLVHEDRPGPGRPQDSTGWYRIYSDNRLWYLPDHYVELLGGRTVPVCNPA